ncbi:MAG: hypothetical protein ACJ8AT_37240 [Hyalangium sp.]
MPGFGPYDSFSDALNAACPLILSKPNATVGYLKEQNPELAWRLSTEYCAWLYYTPDHQYELSMLTDQSESDDLVTKRKSCKLPAFVDDRRYPASSLKYIFALHNHPFASRLSMRDLRFIVDMANAHEWVVETQAGPVPIAIIAFFSNSRDGEHPTCDGFYQYIPGTRELLQWSLTAGTWQREKLGMVTWISETKVIIQKE